MDSSQSSKYSRSQTKMDADLRDARANELEAGARGMRPGDRPREDTEDTANQMRRVSRLQRSGLDLDNRIREAFGGDSKMKKGGPVKMASGGRVRGDGICSRGKTRGRIV